MSLQQVWIQKLGASYGTASFKSSKTDDLSSSHLTGKELKIYVYYIQIDIELLFFNFSHEYPWTY